MNNIESSEPNNTESGGAEVKGSSFFEKEEVFETFSGGIELNAEGRKKVIERAMPEIEALGERIKANANLFKEGFGDVNQVEGERLKQMKEFSEKFPNIPVQEDEEGRPFITIPGYGMKRDDLVFNQGFLLSQTYGPVFFELGVNNNRNMIPRRELLDNEIQDILDMTELLTRLGNKEIRLVNNDRFEKSWSTAEVEELSGSENAKQFTIKITEIDLNSPKRFLTEAFVNSTKSYNELRERELHKEDKEPSVLDLF